MDPPGFPDAAMSSPGSVVLAALDSSRCAQSIAPEKFEAIAQAGDDPASRLPTSKLIPMLRLVASIGRLDAEAITMIERVPSDLISALQKLMPRLLPAGWSPAMALGRLPKDAPYLLELNPTPMNSKVLERAETAFAADLARAVDMQAPILILLPEEAKGPAIRSRRWSSVGYLRPYRWTSSSPRCAQRMVRRAGSTKRRCDPPLPPMPRFRTLTPFP